MTCTCRWFVVGLVLSVMGAQADVRMPGFFNDNMVLQRDRDVPVWGWATPGSQVTVEFAGQSASATVCDGGDPPPADGPDEARWQVMLKAIPASSTPQVLRVLEDGTAQVAISNVVVGDVWICSGQSNMEWTQNRSLNSGDEAKAANFPMIRHVKFGHITAPVPRDDIAGQWQVCTPETVGGFTAVGYYFGRELHKELDVPIGLIGSNWGGTRVEPWTPGFAFVKEPELQSIAKSLAQYNPQAPEGKAFYRARVDEVEAWVEAANKALEAGEAPPSPPTKALELKRSHQDPTVIFNAMISPIVGYGIRGAIWYQGEGNGKEGISYFHKKRALITGWRELWGYEFPFYFVQLANWRAPAKDPGDASGWPKLREAQVKTLSLPKTGMAVIVDIGDEKSVHPQNKQDVGKRLARWALADEYGKDIVYSGPLYKAMQVEEGKIRISFEHVGSGLMVGKKEGLEPTQEAVDGKLARFAIAGEDKNWVWAEAVIDGDAVVVSHPEVAAPVAVRYAFSMNPEGCNLYNKEGLPASPFRTDDW